MHARYFALSLVLIIALTLTTNLIAATQKVLYTFTGGIDGGMPYAGLTFGPDGNLYGVANYGGAYGDGVVFQLSSSQGIWTETVLYTFTGGTDGAQPVGGLTFDPQGNLYGTTSTGNDPSTTCGTVFKLTPGSGGWTITTLHAFSGPDGCAPGADLRLSGVALTGTTFAGGKANQGVAFGVSTSGDFFGYRSFVLYKGREPFGGINSFGYGTTYAGGKPGGGNIYYWGGDYIYPRHVFSLTGKLGYHPLGNLAANTVGGYQVVYGTTAVGGVGGRGAVYQMTHTNTGYPTRLLHSFSGLDGASPGAGVVLDAAGNLYGTTTFGGADPGYAGTVFKLTPGANNTWTHTLLYSFTGGNDGDDPNSSVVLDSGGNIYGTTFRGGAYDQGVVYEVIP